jgi:very-short-patch-repair endonuclease/DNA-directed RNA polymerase subunit N (RpoN/RPB10)
MILTEFVEIKWHYSNKDHFIKLGYKFTAYKDKIIVKIKHLQDGCNVKVSIKCDYCGKNLTKNYNDYLKQLNNSSIKKDCCQECKGLKQIETCQLLYGVNGVSQVNEIKQKQINTIREKYGVDNISKLEEIKEKKKQTTFENYGVEYFSQSIEGKQKIKKTLLERFGVEHHLQLPEIYQKQIDTNIEKYGVENVFQSEEIKDRIKQNLLENYGVEHIMQVPEITEKARINANKSLHKNGTAPCSRQQTYLHILLGGELNYPLKTILLDIAFLKEMVCLEFDGSGHNLNVLCGNITQEEFEVKQSRRNYVLLNRGWKIIRIVSLKDLLPSDEMIIQMYKVALTHFKKENSWIEFNIDEGIIRSSIFEQVYNFGKLRIIKEQDLQKKII